MLQQGSITHSGFSGKSVLQILKGDAAEIDSGLQGQGNGDKISFA